VEAYEAIITRRSIRHYTPQQVSEELVMKLLQAAMMAPSAANGQSWEFVVITDRGLLDEVPNAHPYAAMAREASLAILVCGDTRREHSPGYWIQDCSAAMENLLLAAHALGLGAVWTGIFPVEERVAAIRKLCGLPGHILPLGLAPIGYPAEQRPQPERYDAARVHRNRW